MPLGRLLEGFIVILIGVNLAPSVADSVIGSVYHGGNVSTPTNVTGASATIIQLTTLFFVLGIMAAGVQLAVGGLADIGLI